MLSFTVRGVPVPQGSMKAFMPKGAKFPVLTSDNPKLKAWRKLVRAQALEAMGWLPPAGKNVPIRVQAVFFMPRAKTNKAIDAVKKPDIDKLLRSCLDSMTGVVYTDDSQVVEVHVFKTYGQPRVEIKLEEVGLLAVPRPAAAIIDSDLPF